LDEGQGSGRPGAMRLDISQTLHRDEVVTKILDANDTCA
jgi:hypothetical protein